MQIRSDKRTKVNTYLRLMSTILNLLRLVELDINMDSPSQNDSFVEYDLDRLRMTVVTPLLVSVTDGKEDCNYTRKLLYLHWMYHVCRSFIVFGIFSLRVKTV